MTDLLPVFASFMPFETMLEQLKGAIKAYENDKTDDNKKSIELYCMLVSTKMAVDANKDGIVGLMDELTKMRQGRDLLTPKEQ